VLFNEPKLLKCLRIRAALVVEHGFSALQRAEIAEIGIDIDSLDKQELFQCSSTSRNC